jgi:hypothetical protein
MPWGNKQLIDFADLAANFIRPKSNQQCVARYLPLDVQNDYLTPTGVAPEDRQSGTHILGHNW